MPAKDADQPPGQHEQRQWGPVIIGFLGICAIPVGLAMEDAAVVVLGLLVFAVAEVIHRLHCIERRL